MINLRKSPVKTKTKLSEVKHKDKISVLKHLKKRFLNGTLELQDKTVEDNMVSGWIIGGIRVEKNENYISMYLLDNDNNKLIDYGTYEIDDGGYITIESNESFNIRSKLTLST